MTQEEGRATREDERAPRHRKTWKTDQQRSHTTPPDGPPEQRAARLEDCPSVLGTKDLCRVLRTNRYRVWELVHSGQLRRLAYQPQQDPGGRVRGAALPGRADRARGCGMSPRHEERPAEGRRLARQRRGQRAQPRPLPRARRRGRGPRRRGRRGPLPRVRRRPPRRPRPHPAARAAALPEPIDGAPAPLPLKGRRRSTCTAQRPSPRSPGRSPPSAPRRPTRRRPGPPRSRPRPAAPTPTATQTSPTCSPTCARRSPPTG